MKIFQATVLANAELFETAAAKAFAGNHHKVADNVWLLADTGTAQEVCAKLGMPTTPGVRSPFSAMVVGVSGYYGWVGSNIWEWIAAKQAVDA